MIPAIGDTINNRYTLIALYRSEPGLSAWLANDHTLVRDCQLFIISDSSKLAKVNAIASSLALSRDTHYTRVLHLQKQSGVSVIVTETDPGIALHELLSTTSHSPLGTEAMRSIAGEVAQAADSLRKVSLNHQAISTHVVRVTSTAVTLADAPISPLLTTAVKRTSFHESDETLAVRQIAAVLYEMVTKTPYDPNADPETTRRTWEAYRSEVPAEFTSICTRALGIPQEDGSTPVPIFTLVELLALLGTWRKPGDLGSDQLDLPSKQAAASVESVTLAPVEPRNIVDIPDSLMAVDAVTTVASSTDQSPWRANQLLFAGEDAVEELNPNPDSSNFLSAFESSFQNSVDQLDHVDADFGTSLTSDELTKMQPTQALRITHPVQAQAGDGTSASRATGASSAAGASDTANADAAAHPTASNAAPAGAIPLPSQQELAAAAGTADAADSTADSTTDTPAQDAHVSDATSSDTASAATPGHRSAKGTAGSARTAAAGANAGSGTRMNTSGIAADADEGVGEVTTIIQPIPPTFTPDLEKARLEEAQARTARREAEAEGDAETPKKHGLGRGVALVIAAVVLIGALVWAIGSIGLTPSSTTTQGNGAWTVDANNTPLPDGTMPQTSDADGSDAAADTDKDASTDDADANASSSDADKADKKATTTVETADKTASKVPTPAVPKVTNTTPYTVSSTSIIRNVQGISGLGVHIRLAKSEAVQRVEITSRTGGGQASLYANSDATNPNNGSSLADFSFEEDGAVTQVTLNQPVQTQDLVIWVSQSPSAGFYYTTIRVY